MSEREWLEEAPREPEPPPITPELIEAVGRAIYDREPAAKVRPWSKMSAAMRTPWLLDAEVSIRAVDEARGLRVERSVMVGYFSQDRVPLEDGEIPDPCHELQERVVSDWRSVEAQGDEEKGNP